MARKGGKRTKKSARFVKITAPRTGGVFGGTSGKFKSAKGRPRSKGHGRQRRNKLGQFA